MNEDKLEPEQEIAEPAEIPEETEAPAEETTAPDTTCADTGEDAPEETGDAAKEEPGPEPEESEPEPKAEEPERMPETLPEEEKSLPTEAELTRKEKIKGTVITIALVLAILLCATVVSQVLSQGYVSLGGFSLFRVVTGSMEPEIPVGSLLISRETPLEEIQVNDIVNYKSREAGMFGVVITHRVIALHEVNGVRYLETKGDANAYADVMFVDEEVLIGKVLFYTKAGNWIAKIFSFLTSSVGFLACIVVPCLVIGVTTIQDCINSMKAELNDMNRQLKNVEAKSSRELELTKEEYEQLYSRLRDEVMEELRKSVEAQTEQH